MYYVNNRAFISAYLSHIHIKPTIVILTQNFSLLYKNHTNVGNLIVNRSRVKLFVTNSVIDNITINLTVANATLFIDIKNQTSPFRTHAVPNTRAYQFVNITGTAKIGNTTAAIDNYISSVQYTFSVPKALLASDGVSNGNVRMFKYYANSWHILPTTLIGSDIADYIYTATSSSLSTYEIGFVSTNAVSTSTPLSLTLPAGYATYFFSYGGVSGNVLVKNTKGTVFTDNWTTNTNYTSEDTPAATKVQFNMTNIGYSTARTGTVSGGTAPINISLTGIGENVVLGNGQLFSSSAAATSNTLSYSVATSNSVVILMYASGGSKFASAPTTTAAGCNLTQNVSEGAALPQAASSAILTCNAVSAGSYTASVNSINTSSISIAAYVFPPYDIIFNDSPSAAGNVIANGVLYTNGESTNAIGTAALNASPTDEYAFSNWSVSSAANIIIANSIQANTLVTVEGNGAVTANYKLIPPTLSIEYNPGQYSNKDTITANAPVSTDTVNVIINGAVAASGTGSVSYTICSTASTCLAAGDYNITATDITTGASDSTTLTIVKVPSGIDHFIPISIANGQSSNTPAPFQDMITVNSITYKTYEASNLDNIEFFYGNGTVVPSWMLGNYINPHQATNLTNSSETAYWLKLVNGIPANSAITIYMGFASVGSDILNATATGENPILSPTYAEYDDGFNVFDKYWNFNGTTLPTGWSALTAGTGSSVTADNGLVLFADDAAGTVNPNYYAMAYYNISTNTGNVATVGPNGCNIWTLGYASTLTETLTVSGASLEDGYLGFGEGGQSGGLIINKAGTLTYLASGFPAGAAMYTSLRWISGAQYISAYNSSSKTIKTLTASDTTYSPGSTNYLYYAVGAYNGNNTCSNFWIATRAYPPNAVMPTATFGTVQNTLGKPTLTIASNPITYGNLSDLINASGNPNTDTIELSINGNVVAGPAAGALSYAFNSIAPGFGAGAYTVNAFDENTLSSTIINLTVDKAAPVLNITNSPRAFIYNGSGDTIDFSINTINSQVTSTLMINGNAVATTAASNTYTASSSIGNYSIALSSPSTANYIAASISSGYNILGKPPYRVPITLTNSQASNTPAPFQQALTVNSLNYTTYLAPNLDNVLFFYANGTIIPSWLESGKLGNGTVINSNTLANKLNQSVASLYWLKLVNGIPANSAITIYMGFEPSTISVLNKSASIGEAPQLTSIYAQYDGGKGVFTNYWNFNGTTLPAGWNIAYSGGGVIVDNSLNLQASTTNAQSFVDVALSTTNVIADYYFISTGGAGVVAAWTNGVPAGRIEIGGTSSYLLYNGYAGYAVAGQKGNIYLAQSTGATGFGVNESILRPGVFSFYWISGAQHFWGNYGSEVSAANTTLAPGATNYLYAGGDWYYSTDAVDEIATYQWIRTRAYPPNGVMPTATFGVIQGYPALKIKTNPITYGNLSDLINASGNPNTDTIELSINGNVVAGPAAGTLSYAFNSIAPGFGAGTYTANAFDENTLYSTIINLTVDKAIPAITLPNFPSNYTYDGNAATANAVISSVGNQLTANVFVNNALIASFDTSNEMTLGPAAGTYTVVANTPGNGNYVAATATNTLLISKAIPAFEFTFENSTNTITLSTDNAVMKITTALPFTINSMLTTVANQLDGYFMENGNIIATTNTIYSDTFAVGSLGQGNNYTFTLNSAGNTNYTTFDSTFMLYIPISTTPTSTSSNEKIWVYLNDNINNTASSNTPVFYAYVIHQSGEIKPYAYYQNQLPTRIPFSINDKLNFTFACSFITNGTTYYYASDTYGLGFVPCGKNYTVYGGTYEVIYNNTPAPVYTTTSTTTTSTSTTTIPIVHIAPNSVSIRVGVTRSTPVRMVLFNTGFLIQSNSLSPVGANITITNITASAPSPPGYSKLSVFRVDIHPQGFIVNLTFKYGCTIPIANLAIFAYANGTWTQFRHEKANQSACTMQTVVPQTYGIFGLFEKLPVSNASSSTTIPASPITPVHPPFAYSYDGIAVGIGAITIIVIFLLYYIKKKRKTASATKAQRPSKS